MTPDEVRELADSARGLAKTLLEVVQIAQTAAVELRAAADELTAATEAAEDAHRGQATT